MAYAGKIYNPLFHPRSNINGKRKGECSGSFISSVQDRPVSEGTQVHYEETEGRWTVGGIQYQVYMGQLETGRCGKPFVKMFCWLLMLLIQMAMLAGDSEPSKFEAYVYL